MIPAAEHRQPADAMVPPAKPDSEIRRSLREWTLPLLMALALMLGGGGSPSPAMEILLQLVFAVLTVIAVWAGSFRTPAGPIAWWVAGLVILLPVAQLIPLPPSVWGAMPGRGLVAEALDLIGAKEQWRALSIAPHRTLAGLLAVAPALVVLILTAASSGNQITKALWAIIAMAVLAAMLGAVQVSTAGAAGHLYESTHRGWVTGFFANRNAAADLFVIAIMAGLAVANGGGSANRHGRLPLGFAGVIVLLLAVAAIMTGSRVGIALLAGLTACWVIWSAGRSLRFDRQKAAMTGFAMMAGTGGLIALGWLSGGLRNVAARFGANGDMRTDIWPDTLEAIGRFWPVGSGFGTFQQAFAPSQRLETLGPAIINRAHNDFLELALEGGLAALVIVVVIAVLLARNALAQWRTDLASRALLVFAGGALVLLAMHSVVDYPLRSMALAVICAFGVGILAKPASKS